MTADWPGPKAPADDRPDATTVQDERGTITVPAASGPPTVAAPTEPPTFAAPTELPAEPARRWGLPTVALVPIAAVVWWVVGFLPWILSGLGHDTLRSAGMRPAAIPLFTGNVSSLVVGCGVGGLAAGLVTLLGRGSRVGRAAAVVAGVALSVAVVVAQSRDVLALTDGRVLDALTALVVVMTVVSLAVGLLAVAGRIGLGITLAGVAGAAPGWIVGVLYQVGLDRAGPFEAVVEVSRWVGAVVLAGALVSIGVRPLVRLVWWPVAVVLAWIVGPTVTAAVYAEQLLRPGMSLPEMLGEQVSASLDVWRLAASFEIGPLPQWIAAVVAATVISLVLDHRRVVPAE